MLWMTSAAIMDESLLEGTRHRMPTEEQRANAAAILNDHVHGLHESMDDPEVGCRWPGCDAAYWLLASLQEPGPVSIEDLLR